MKKIFKLGVSLFVAMTLLTIITATVFAASKTTEIIAEQVSITDSSGSGKGNADTYTITAKGGIASATTNKITIENISGEKAEISFSYSVTGSSAFKIDSESVGESGTCLKELDAGAAISIEMTANAWKTATLILSGITYKPIAESADITVLFDSECGTVTANGVNVENEEVVTVDKAGATFVATPASDAKFIAWVEEDGKVISKQTSYTQSSTGDKIVKALFAKKTAYFSVFTSSEYILDDLNKAAKMGNTVVLECDGTLGAGTYTIPSGVTLLIPFDDANTMYTTVPGHNKDTDLRNAAPYITPTAYRTLTMENGAKIIVNGAIEVSAKQASIQGRTGYPTGTYGLIDMKDGSSITVNNDGNLYVWGYITGQGTVTAESGATVYECFQIADWRGGSAISDMVDNIQKVFPMSQYYVQNIEVPLTLKKGAVENGYTSAFVSFAGTQGCSIPFIGGNGMFRIESGSITKDYDEATDRLIVDVDGNLNMSNINLSMKLTAIGTKTITSQNYVLPINGNITLDVNSGSTVNISQDIALLPGGVINVENGATCNLASGVKVFIYDNTEWTGYCYTNNSKYVTLAYAPGRLYTRDDKDFVDAKIHIEGIVDASKGSVYVTGSGANICGGEGGVVRFNQVADTDTYQATQNNTAISYVSIPVTTAKLKNGEGAYVEYVEHDGKHTELYYAEGVWNPTHNEVTVEAVAPTCTEDGMTDGIKCSLCEAWIKEQTTVSATGHTYINYVCACGKEKIATDTEYTISGNDIVITPSLTEDAEDSSVIMVAVYDSSYKLLDSKSFLKSQLDKVTFSNKDVNMIKVFAWGGFDTIEPIALVEEKTVQQ